MQEEFLKMIVCCSNKHIMALRVRYLPLSLHRHIVQTICRTAAQQQTQHVRGCATASQPPQQEQQTTEETEEIKTESKQVRRFEKPKTEAEIQDEWRQTIHWRQPKEHMCTKPVDPSLVPIEDRQPIPSFPLQPGEKPTASNFVVPLPPPPVPVDPYFQDQVHITVLPFSVHNYNICCNFSLSMEHKIRLVLVSYQYSTYGTVTRVL